MKRREPPPLATWMLAHLTVGERDEALDGDLLEVFQLGRSDRWYWRQVITACVLSWFSSIYARRPALAFALLWSILAPVWYATLETIDTSQNFDKGSQIFGPLWLPLVLVIWVVLHAAFLWAGLLVFQFAHLLLEKPLSSKDLGRAFWIAALILPPIYGLTFLFANLYWYSLPGLAQSKLATTAWGQLSDLRLLAILIRIPYFIAMATALWGTVHRVRRETDPLFFDSLSRWASAESGEISARPIPDPAVLRRSIVFMVCAGLVNSMITALFFCHLPDLQPLALGSLFAKAFQFVVIGAVGGIAGSWLYWKSPASPLREQSPIPFSLFASTCTAGWVWIPAMMLFAEQVSAATAFVAMIGAFLIAKGLRAETYFVFASSQTSPVEWSEGELFAESLSLPPFEAHGYLIAIGLFAAGAALATKSNYTAAILLAMCASLFAWKNTIPRREVFDRDIRRTRAAVRVAVAIIPAIIFTVWAMLDGVAHRNIAAEASAITPVARAANHPPADSKTPITTSGAGGYRSVVLWPFPQKKEIVPPILPVDSILAPGTKRPLIIRFDGPYWFLQPPSRQPGPEAHVAQGTPVDIDFESNNAVALVMTAHQKLARPVPVGRCREITIGIENRDNKAGLISIALFLNDETSSSKQTLYLGQQPIVSTEPGNFFVKTKPAYETLRFQLPPHATPRKFNEITLMFLPDIEHTFVAPRIAIRQFEIFPR